MFLLSTQLTRRCSFPSVDRPHFTEIVLQLKFRGLALKVSMGS